LRPNVPAMPTPDCQGPGEPDFKRKWVPKRVTRQQGAEKALRPPACRETLPGPGKGIAPLGSIRKRDPRFARPCATLPCRPAGPGTTQASARPGGREAPAGGGAGAGRGLWPPAGKGQRGAVAGAMAPAIEALTVPSPFRAGSGNATRVSPARAQRFPADRQVRAPRKASARPGGRKAPAGGGAGAGRGLLAPGWSRISAALRQGRWPLRKCARRAQSEAVPALR